VFDLGEKEGYALRTHERDLDSDGNWSWGEDSHGTIVLRHRGEDCPNETLSELVLHLLDSMEVEKPPTEPVETPAAPATHDFLR
jgi:hypothetical protein